MMFESNREGSRRPGAFSILIGALVVGLLSTSVACQEPTKAAPPLPPLTATYESPEALAEAFLEALRMDDVEALKAFALNEDEFRLHVWPELPSSRPERNVPFEYGWGDLHQKSINCLRRTHHRFAGESLTFLGIKFDGETTEYETFKVHRDARVRVRDATGRELELDLFGSILEKSGRFKLFSYVTD